MKIHYGELSQGIIVSLLIILLGWVLARKGHFNAEITAALNRFLVDIAFPLMIFTQIISSTSLEVLQTHWPIPLLGAALYIIGVMIGLIFSRFLNDTTLRPTFIFLTATPNWIFLPLIIMETLFGEAGIRTVLLYNVGFLVMIWTLGVWILRGYHFNLKTIKETSKNPALWATLLGLFMVIYHPAQELLHLRPEKTSFLSPMSYFGPIFFQVASMIGKMTIPLSLLVTGSILQKSSSQKKEALPVTLGVLTSRMILTPLLSLMIYKSLPLIGLSLSPVEFTTGIVIMSMPAGVNTTALSIRFKGKPSLASGAVLYGHLLVIFLLPLWFSFL